MSTDISGAVPGPWYTPASTENPPDAAEPLMLVYKPHDPPTELKERLNRLLDDLGSGWSFEPEEGAHENTYSRVTPLRMRYRDVGDSRTLPGVGSLLALLVRSGAIVSADPALAVFPGYKPGGADLGLFGSPGFRSGALTRGDFGRVPVRILAQDPPPRRPRSALRGGRRPVVALLDTAVRSHPWLGPPDPDLKGDGFWVEASEIREKAWRPGARLAPRSAVEVGEPGRELGAHEGHGTFCTGLIRQVAPDARVLAVHVIDDDGGVYGDLVLNALGWLCDSGDLVEGDVVCLPVGFRPVWSRDKTYIEWLGAELGELGERGVLVVAAAGNDGEDDPVYPAAFAASANQPKTRLVSVGAYNANGRTRAEYSNYGHWVTDWEVGTSVVSTFPMVDGAARPELAFDDGRESADPDDFTGGFSRWSGTSFAAAIYAGRYAQRKAVAASDAVENEPT